MYDSVDIKYEEKEKVTSNPIQLQGRNTDNQEKSSTGLGQTQRETIHNADPKTESLLMILVLALGFLGFLLLIFFFTTTVTLMMRRKR